jgi:hypothetical protein
VTQKFEFLKQVGEFLDAQFEIVNDAAHRLSLDSDAGVHRDHDSRLIAWTHVDRMTACLPPKLKPQALRDAGYFFARE